MAQRAGEASGVAGPRGEARKPLGGKPIDLAHLARQTMGDRALEREVLSLFLQQLADAREQLTRASDEECRQLAHTLKGAAAGVGAFGIVECVAALEEAQTPECIARLGTVIDEVRAFIVTIRR